MVICNKVKQSLAQAKCNAKFFRALSSNSGGIQRSARLGDFDVRIRESTIPILFYFVMCVNPRNF